MIEIQGHFGERALRLLLGVGTQLEDIIEDILVEVEIKVSDDIRIIQGFRTLLALTMTPDFPSPHGHSHADIEKDLQTFIDESSTRLGTIVPERKLDDVQHDLATLKLAFHKLSFPLSADVSQVASVIGGQFRGSNPSSWNSFVSSLDFRLTMLPQLNQGPDLLGYSRSRIPSSHAPRILLDRSRVSGFLGLRSLTTLIYGTSDTALDVSPTDSIHKDDVQ